MCGIFLSIATADKNSTSGKPDFVYPDNLLQSRLRSRGPDSYGSVERIINKNHVTFVSTVLSLRSSSTIAQPFPTDAVPDRKCPSNPLLLWNGESWAINGVRVGSNDTEAVFSHLASAVPKGEDTVVAALNAITGPFALVFFDGISRLYIARDCLGRRSLLHKTVREDGHHVLLVTSVGDETGGWEEVEAEGIWVVDLSIEDINQGKVSLNRNNDLDSSETVEHGADRLDRRAVRRNKTHLYADAAKFPTLNRSLPIHQGEIEQLALDSAFIESLEDLLSTSVAARVGNIPLPPPTTQILNPSSKSQLEAPSKLAILFSGGLDCTLLARIMHHHVPLDESVDLLNVAFHNPRSHGPEPTLAAFESCPDRLTARSSIEELQTCCPGRIWRLVTIDIPYAESIAHRDIVRSLMYPHNTEMDLSIAYALYFASRGIGSLRKDDNGARYCTSARVLISGLGADELFGGYQRHATAFSRNGYNALLDELDLDIKRLGKRNLGRDDRILSHWGREVRFPYLDETFVKYAVEAPFWEKCGFGQHEMDRIKGTIDGSNVELEPGKLALRLLSYKLGMKRVACEKKRAIQFGARTAKLGGGGKTKGTQQIA